CTDARGHAHRYSVDSRSFHQTGEPPAKNRVVTRRNSRPFSALVRRSPVAQIRRTETQSAFTQLPNASLPAPRKRRVVCGGLQLQSRVDVYVKPKWWQEKS